jgi:thiamine-phosphate pyrophosphorylase
LFLYYITDRRQLSSDPDESVRLLLDRISAVAKADVDAIQLREKDLSARELVELGRRAAEIIHRANSPGASRVRTRLLINSRVDAAIACGSDGVHLRSDDVSAADARVVFAQAGVSSPVIGVSCHTVQEVLLAEGHGADFAVYGPVFGKAGNEIPSTGLPGLEAACRKRKAAEHPMPVLALGGVTAASVVNCLKAGAHGIAGIRLFQNGNPVETVSQLRKLAKDQHC